MSKAVPVDWRSALVVVGLLLAGFAVGYMSHREVVYTTVFQTVTRTVVTTATEVLWLTETVIAAVTVTTTVTEATTSFLATTQPQPPQLACLSVDVTFVNGTSGSLQLRLRAVEAGETVVIDSAGLLLLWRGGAPPWVAVSSSLEVVLVHVKGDAFAMNVVHIYRLRQNSMLLLHTYTDRDYLVVLEPGSLRDVRYVVSVEYVPCAP